MPKPTSQVEISPGENTFVETSKKRLVCSFCLHEFNSRNKLFKHLSECDKALESGIGSKLISRGKTCRQKIAIFFGVSQFGISPPLNVATRLATALNEIMNVCLESTDLIVNTATTHPQTSELIEDPRVSSVCNVADVIVDSHFVASVNAKNKLLSQLKKKLFPTIQIFDIIKVESRFRSSYLCTQKTYHYVIPLRVFNGYPTNGDRLQGIAGGLSIDLDPLSYRRTVKKNKKSLGTKFGTNKNKFEINNQKGSDSIHMKGELSVDTSGNLFYTNVHSTNKDGKIEPAEGSNWPLCRSFADLMPLYRRLKATCKKFRNRQYASFHNYNASAKLTPSSSISLRQLLRVWVATQFHLDGQDYCVLGICGDNFLTNQIRSIIGLLIAIMNDIVPISYIELSLRTDAAMIPLPLAPIEGLYLSDVRFERYENSTQTHMRPCTFSCSNGTYSGGFCNDENVLDEMLQHRKILRQEAAQFWQSKSNIENGFHTKDYETGVEYDTKFDQWKAEILLPMQTAMQSVISLYSNQTNEVSNVLNKSQISNQISDNNGYLSNQIPYSNIENQKTSMPAVYKKVLRLLRAADTSGRWPSNTTRRAAVIQNLSHAQEQSMNSTKKARREQIKKRKDFTNEKRKRKLKKVTIKSTEKTSCKEKTKQNIKDTKNNIIDDVVEGNTFSVGTVPGGNATPRGNILFPELVKACFELESLIMPDRPPSSTIAINRNAQFKPHRDTGVGAGQTKSLIVGLGDYTGGELVVEEGGKGVKKGIRYCPLEFNGWTQLHWTLPFKGERYSLVWFTPFGCENFPGIELDL